MTKVLFVCLGNICRSPLAEGIFNHLIQKHNLSGEISCDSAGTSGWHLGEPPDERSVEVAQRHDIELEHLGRQFTTMDFQVFDYIIAMDRQNYSDIIATPGYEDFDPARVLLMRAFDELHPDEDVPDPYFGGNEGFDKVYEMLYRSCERLLGHVQNEATR